MPEQLDATDLSALRLSVVIPAYNEEARIGATIERALAYLDSRGESYELLVVDDGSADSTVKVVQEACSGHSNVSISGYGGNRGKGYAVRHGMLRARGAYVLFSDADLSTPIEELESLMRALKAGIDIAIASRDLPESRLERRQNPIREFGGKVFNRFVQFMAVPGIHDTQCGFKLFTHAAAQNVFGRCQIDNFSFDVEALYLARQLGYRIAEVPVTWRHAEGSKVRFVRDALRMAGTLIRIRVTDYQIHQAGQERTPTP